MDSTGTGTWNKQAVCAFEVLATDQGERGKKGDTLTITISCPSSPVVSVSDEVGGGNVQSKRLKH